MRFGRKDGRDRRLRIPGGEQRLPGEPDRNDHDRRIGARTVPPCGSDRHGHGERLLIGYTAATGTVTITTKKYTAQSFDTTTGQTACSSL